MLLPGVLLGATWLTGPVFGAGCVVLYWLALRRGESRSSVSLGGALLFMLAPTDAAARRSSRGYVVDRTRVRRRLCRAVLACVAARGVSIHCLVRCRAPFHARAVHGVHGRLAHEPRDDALLVM